MVGSRICSGGNGPRGVFSQSGFRQACVGSCRSLWQSHQSIRANVLCVVGSYALNIHDLLTAMRYEIASALHGEVQQHSALDRVLKPPRLQPASLACVSPEHYVLHRVLYMFWNDDFSHMLTLVCVWARCAWLSRSDRACKSSPTPMRYLRGLCMRGEAVHRSFVTDSVRTDCRQPCSHTAEYHRQLPVASSSSNSKSVMARRGGEVIS